MTNHNVKVMTSSDFPDYDTPQAFVDSLPFDFDIDVAATHDNAKCDLWISPTKNTLKQTWGKRVCWMNPPYNRPENPCKDPDTCEKKSCAKRGYHLSEYRPGCIDFMVKAYEESLKGSLVVCLVKVSPGSTWFRNIWEQFSLMCFLDERIKYTKPGTDTTTAPFDNVIIVFGDLNKNKATKSVKELISRMTKFGVTIEPGYGNIHFIPSEQPKKKIKDTEVSHSITPATTQCEDCKSYRAINDADWCSSKKRGNINFPPLPECKWFKHGGK